MTTINKDVSKRAIFVQEFRSVVETMNIFSKVATILVSTAKYVQSPFTSVTVAKSYTQASRVPIGTLTVSKNELVLDRKVGNAITDDEEELSYAKFDVIGMIRSDLYASIIKKANQLAVSDFVTDATAAGSTIALTTAAEVREFLIGIAADSAQTVGLKNKVDGATIKRGERHGKAFVACGRTAFVAITSLMASVVAQSSLKGIDGDFVDTPYGVLVINLGDAADNVKRLIYGTAGAPTIAYREDKVNVDMGEIVSTGVASGTDLDLVLNDPVLDKTWYVSADMKGKNGIFSDVQSLVTAGLMT